MLKDGWVAQADPNQWNGYYGYGQGYDAYGYGTTQDPSLYAYGGYGYPQYPQQVNKMNLFTFLQFVETCCSSWSTVFQGEGTQDISNSAAGGIAGAEQELYDPLATPDVDK